MVVIRMSRSGAKKRPFYRLVVTDSRTKRDGMPIERVGFFNPLARDHEEKLRLDLERVNYWLKVGARVSTRLKSLIKKKSIENIK
jgi:small subunit ribosomal protein S16